MERERERETIILESHFPDEDDAFTLWAWPNETDQTDCSNTHSEREKCQTLFLITESRPCAFSQGQEVSCSDDRK